VAKRREVVMFVAKLIIGITLLFVVTVLTLAVIGALR
jgi:hypothetical protein